MNFPELRKRLDIYITCSLDGKDYITPKFDKAFGVLDDALSSYESCVKHVTVSNHESCMKLFEQAIGRFHYAQDAAEGSISSIKKDGDRAHLRRWERLSKELHLVDKSLADTFKKLKKLKP